MDFNCGMIERSLYQVPDLLEARCWSRFQPLGEVDPYLVLPGYGKAFDVRANTPLWYKPEWFFSFTHNVYIIGLSLAHDDFFIRSFFLATLPYINSYSGTPGRKIVIINPSKDVHNDYDFVLRKNQAEVWQECFCSEHIKRFMAKE